MLANHKELYSLARCAYWMASRGPDRHAYDVLTNVSILLHTKNFMLASYDTKRDLDRHRSTFFSVQILPVCLLVSWVKTVVFL